MHILLINANPVISRLLTLCTRDAEMVLEELEDITVAKRKQYDIIFVDETSYKNEVLQLDEYVTTDKKVLFSNEDIVISTFDMTIEKPFLPSQIIELLDNIERTDEQEKENVQDLEDEDIAIFSTASEDTVDKTEPQVLDSTEVEKIKALLNMDDELEITEVLSDDEIEVRKMEVIKEQLIAEGLEIIDEDEIVEELSAKDAIKIFEDDEEPQVENVTTTRPEKKQKTKSQKKKKNKSKKKHKKTLNYTEQQLEKIEDAIEMAIATLKRKQMKKLIKGKKIKVEVQIKGQYS